MDLNSAWEQRGLNCFATSFFHKRESEISQRITRAVKPLSSVSRLSWMYSFGDPQQLSVRSLLHKANQTKLKPLDVQKPTGFITEQNTKATTSLMIRPALAAILKIDRACQRGKMQEQGMENKAISETWCDKEEEGAECRRRHGELKG